MNKKSGLQSRCRQTIHLKEYDSCWTHRNLPRRYALHISCINLPECKILDRQYSKQQCRRKQGTELQTRLHGSHLTELIPVQFHSLSDATTLSELKKVLNVKGRYLKTSDSTAVTWFESSNNNAFLHKNNRLTTLNPYNLPTTCLKTRINRNHAIPSDIHCNVPATAAAPLHSIYSKLATKPASRIKLDCLEVVQQLDITRESLCDHNRPNSTRLHFKTNSIQTILKYYQSNGILWHINYIQRCLSIDQKKHNISLVSDIGQFKYQKNQSSNIYQQAEKVYLNRAFVIATAVKLDHRDVENFNFEYFA
ncbi:uncharacterized protein LOC121588623 isoform X2 [Anopheles merus]|uniref:uncharacterized protein LOC121588623 isoform X2 n=1 Tax=Anopheles merus TaxID=30066 RepID=UPI001BE44AEA|nr:uncharacterized protein LOC121588623 isoform X2 [Anopheles merus]